MRQMERRLRDESLPSSPVKVDQIEEITMKHNDSVFEQIV